MNDEARILETLRREAERLLASPDALMRSQYQHLYGRITALIAARASAAQPDAPE
ncbi:MAG: hypothetical protein U1F45_05730 [Burkholderiales bacterium]